MMTHGALHVAGILSHSSSDWTSVLVVASEPICKKDAHKIDWKTVHSVYSLHSVHGNCSDFIDVKDIELQ